jgi:hypothetical protein
MRLYKSHATGIARPRKSWGTFWYNVPQMARPSRALKAEIIPAWQAFVGDAVPFGAASAALAAAVGENARGSWAAKSTGASIFRRSVSGRVERPTVDSMWAFAEVIREVPGNEWCAAPLVLFAAGYFERFAQTMLGANRNLLKPKRLEALLDATAPACAPTVRQSEADLVAALRAEGMPDTVIQKTIRRRRSRGNAPVRPERNVWVLNDEEYAAFSQAFLAAPNPLPLGVLSSRLAELHPEIGMENQRAIVLAAIRGERN